MRWVLWVIGVLAALPLLAHLPELGGWLSCNPIVSAYGTPLDAGRVVLRGTCYIDGNAGFTLQALGHEAAGQWLAGRVPWWNPYAALGLPLAAEMQPAAMFLPFVLLLQFFQGVLYLKLTLHILAGLFSYVWLRELRMGGLACLLGAAIYEMNGSFVLFGDAPSFPGAFLPLIMFGIARAARRGGTGGIVPLALGLAWLLLAGFPEAAFLDGLLALAWAVLVVAQSRGPARTRLAAKITAGGVLGLCLAAPALLPFLHYLTLADLWSHATISGSTLSHGQGLALVLPLVFGAPFQDGALVGWAYCGGFFGAGAVFLALLGLLGARAAGQSWRWLAGGWALFWLAAALGLPPAATLCQALPGLNQVGVSRYGMGAVAFCISALAAAAVHDWRAGEMPARRPAWALLLWAAVVAAGAASAAMAGRFNAPAMAGFMPFPVIGFTAGMVLAVLLTCLLARRSSLRVALALGAALCVDLLAQDLPSALAGTRARHADWAGIKYLQQHIGLSRAYAIGGVLQANYGTYFHVPTLNVLSVPRPAAWVEYAARLDPQPGNALTPLPPWLGQANSARELADRRSAFAATATRFILAPAAGDTIAALQDPAFRPVFADATVHIYELADAAAYFTAGCTLTAETRDSLHADCAAPAHLLRHEMMFPGWRALVNGRKAPIRMADDIFQQIDLPAGSSDITFRYAPPHVRVIWILFFTGAGCVGGLLGRQGKVFFFEKKNQKTFVH